MDEAALDFAKTYNDDSIRKNREFGSSIYESKDGKYFYTVPKIGSKKSVSMSKKRGEKLVATIHTHTDGERMDVFSDIDLINSNRKGVIYYLVIASGGLFKYDPKKGYNIETAYTKYGNPQDITKKGIPNLYNYKLFPENKGK